MLMPVLKSFESLVIQSKEAVPASEDAYFVPRTDHSLFCELVCISRTVTNINPLLMGTAATRRILALLRGILGHRAAQLHLQASCRINLMGYSSTHLAWLAR